MGKVNKPKNKGVANVPVILQLEMLECGAACLDMILAYYGKWLPLEQIRADCAVNRNGSIASNIIKAAKMYDLDFKAFRMEPGDLMKQGTYPCIIHWDFNHFVVLNGFRGNHAIINDPARGKVKVSMEEFDKLFTGIVIFFKPNENFKPSGEKRTLRSYFNKAIKGYKAEATIILISTIILSILGIVFLSSNRIFIDNILDKQYEVWISWFFAFFVLVIILNTIVYCFLRYVKWKALRKIETATSTEYLWKVLHLPMSFFEQRMSEEIAQRLGNSKNIAHLIVEIIIPIAAGIIMMVVYIVLLFCNNVYLVWIALAALIINIIVDIYSKKVQENSARIMLRDTSNLTSYSLSGTNMIEEIQASGSEKAFVDKWKALQKNVILNKSDNLNKLRISSVIPKALKTFLNLALLLIGVYTIVYHPDKGATIGYLFFVQGLLMLFFDPITKILDLNGVTQTITHQIDLIEDVTNSDVDDTFKNETPIDGSDELTGDMRIDNVDFGYSKLDKPIISDFSLHAKPGSKIAICGASGSGKSTITKLISNLYKPWSGQITFDGKQHSQINRNLFLQSVSVCEQNVSLIDGTIEDNIKMWDSFISNEQMFCAAKDACIHEDIMLMRGGYQHKITKGGQDLSGGQKQRIEIARALVKNPKICILDEATSALDAITESKIIQAINKRGITCIIIAHRLSTIRNCDEIIVLDNGEIVERGKHTELIEANGYYKQLVEND